MLFPLTLSAIALLLSGAHARISGFRMPKTIKAGDEAHIAAAAKSIAATEPPADIELEVTYGFAPVSSASLSLGGSLGTLLSSIDFSGTYI